MQKSARYACGAAVIKNFGLFCTASVIPGHLRLTQKCFLASGGESAGLILKTVADAVILNDVLALDQNLAPGLTLFSACFKGCADSIASAC